MENNTERKKPGTKKGHKKTYPPIKVTPECIELHNITIYPKEKRKETTTAYAWQRTGSYRDDYCVNIRVFGEFQTNISWKVAEAMCTFFANTTITSVEQWKEVNRAARAFVTSSKGGPQYGKENN